MDADRVRLAGLDGLRGVAALVVVVTHVAMIRPELSNTFIPRIPPRGSADWFVSATPLHLFWAGPEAVYVFFVLSGYVLTYSMARSSSREWAAYYPSRIVRLYLPVWAAATLAAIWIIAVPRRHIAGGSLFLNAHGSPISISGWLDDLLLMPSPGVANTVLWSLKWEVIFSVLLPIYIRVIRRTWMVPLLLGAIVVGVHTGQSAVKYLPMFGLGVALAQGGAHAWLSGSSRSKTYVLLVIALLALNASWYGYINPTLTVPVAAFGALALVALVAESQVGALLTGRWIQFLGKVSFSLYLVHEPVVVSCAYVLGGTPSVWLELLIALPVSLLISHFFYRGIEAPTIRLARRLRYKIAGRVNAGELQRKGEQLRLGAVAEGV